MSESNIQPAKNGRDVKVYLTENIARIAAVCERHTSPEKVIQIVAIVAYRTPRLAECTPASVVAGVIQATSLGLDLHPSSGEAHLVPRWNKKAQCLECTFVVGYQGLCKLARGAGTRYIAARIVRERDVFIWRFSPELDMLHEPCRDADPGLVLGAYCVARTETNELVGEYMSVAEIEVIRSKSSSPKEGPWVDYPDEMRKKTPCRRLCKWLPKSPKLVEALASIDADVRQEPPPEDDPSVPPEAPKVDRITAVVAARAIALKPSNGNGHSEPPATPPPTSGPAPVAQVEVRPAIAATVTATVEPLPPRNGEELARHAAESETLGWFEQFGESKGYPRRLKFWNPDYVKLAWAEYQNEGMERS